MALSEDGLNWNNKWYKRSYSSETGVMEWSGRREFLNDMPNLNMGTMSYCFSVNPIEVFFWDNTSKKWYDEDNNEVHQIWQD